MAKFTNIVDERHPGAGSILVVDENNKLISHVKSYNNLTKEAEVYKIGDDGKAVCEWNNPNNKTLFPLPGQKEHEYGRHPVIDKVILKGSRLVFREFPAPEINIIK